MSVVWLNASKRKFRQKNSCMSRFFVIFYIIIIISAHTIKLFMSQGEMEFSLWYFDTFYHVLSHLKFDNTTRCLIYDSKVDISFDYNDWKISYSKILLSRNIHNIGCFQNDNYLTTLEMNDDVKIAFKN